MGRKLIVLLTILVFIGIQFYRPNKNVQSVSNYHDFLVHEKAPRRIISLIQNSCYNCHSNKTEYFWYDNIAPISWYVDNNISIAKEHLNFSIWAVEDYRNKRAHLSRMANSIRKNTMPALSYELIHPSAKLNKEEKQKILDWLYTIEINEH